MAAFMWIPTSIQIIRFYRISTGFSKPRRLIHSRLRGLKPGWFGLLTRPSKGRSSTVLHAAFGLRKHCTSRDLLPAQTRCFTRPLSPHSFLDLEQRALAAMRGDAEMLVG